MVPENHATVKRDSKVASPGSESRIELQNPQILKKIFEKSSQFLSSEQPCGPKSLEVVLKIAGVEKIRLENLRCGQPGGHSIPVFNERSVSDGGNMCLLWLVIQFKIVSETSFSCYKVGHEL